jgi:hypothetical protein
VYCSFFIKINSFLNKKKKQLQYRCQVALFIIIYSAHDLF